MFRRFGSIVAVKSEAIQKLYYSITEVAQILGEEQHVLRYWEREFTQLKPAKNRAGNRVYTTKDLGILRVIKRLLREERYTVAGAKEYLRTHDLQLEVQEEAMERKAAEELHPPATVHQVSMDLDAVRSAVGELVEIAGSIRQRAAAARQR